MGVLSEKELTTSETLPFFSKKRFAYPVHRHSGCTRFKVSGLYKSPAMKQRLEDAMYFVNGVKQCYANPLTGTVLVHHAQDTAERELAQAIDHIVKETIKELVFGRVSVKANQKQWHEVEPDDAIRNRGRDGRAGRSGA